MRARPSSWLSSVMTGLISQPVEAAAAAHSSGSEPSVPNGADIRALPSLRHIVPYDASSRGIVRAYCGACIQQREVAEHVDVASCEVCRARYASHEASILACVEP